MTDPAPETNDLDAQARELEDQLTYDQKTRAFALAMANGWFPGSRPPTAFWIQWFRIILREDGHSHQ